jgi:peptidyl-prolyl cis-trans isomerase B (cyclophilin B)
MPFPRARPASPVAPEFVPPSDKERTVATNVKPQVDEAQKKIDLATKNYQVELDTSKGPIRLTFLPEAAPGHVKNFIALAKIGFYDNLTFHRVIPGFMIQGGCPLGTGTGNGGYNVKAEFNGTPHVAGVLSMARSNSPDSASTQFFLCLDKHSHLDRNYTAFGKTADDESLKTVKAIGAVKTGSGDRPTEKVVIRKATVQETPK